MAHETPATELTQSQYELLKNAPVAVRAAPRPNQKTQRRNGVISMAVLPKRARLRKLNPLPLFDWAERNGATVFNPLLITKKLARHFDMSASSFNAIAEAHGYTGRGEADVSANSLHFSISL